VGTDTASGPRTAVKLATTAVGAFLMAAGITFVFLGMRAVLDVGGFCAEGGPYEIRQECPDGSGFMLVGILCVLLAAGALVLGAFRDGPRLWALAWPIGFLALGWNFATYALDPPPGIDGSPVGWWICAVVFVGIALMPVIPMARDPRAVFWGRAADARTGPATLASRLFGPRDRWSSGGSGAPGFTVRSGSGAGPVIVIDGRGTVDFVLPDAPEEGDDGAAGGVAPDPSGGPGDLVADLERLAAMHRAGVLDDAEFAAAKAARLAEERG